ncbi:S-adenosyl-L-methionine-dependent methyltransferase [Tribonema minus]|uniref:DNA (cytosine-5-)-methyltransferase n=1 Tax=Tribonema minus TaxID=303371 RepID=A0A836CCV2_9STRA|nr:S-adenosyl-L-methionine-dependent methyltransferase [Tribonema minus]
MHVIDLFCGAGGFSTGAAQEGAVVVLAVDGWRDALDVHAANHPGALHWCETLGGPPAEFAERLRGVIAEAVPPGEQVHLHASPPCQNLSQVNAGRDEGVGLALVAWCFELVDLVRPDSWTVEQVPNAALLRRFAHVPHGVYDMAAHGVPQTRRRVIFGHAPRLEEEGRASFEDALRGAGLDAGGHDEQCNGSIKKRGEGGEAIYYRRSLRDPSYTVTARFPVFVRGRADMTSLDVRLAAALQGFPPGYFPPDTPRVRQMIGNALPPPFARRLVRSAPGRRRPPAGHVKM